MTDTTTLAPATPQGAARGLQWWSSAISWLFADVAQLGVWVIMAIVFFILTIILHFIPLLGSIASFLLHFVLSGGLLLAASKTARGAAPPFNDLFAGFGPAAGPLVSTGMLVGLALLALFAVMFAIGVGAALSSIIGSMLHDMTLPGAEAVTIGLGALGLLFVCLLVLIPISMAAWQAPALVMLRGTAPLPALRMSLAACQRNLGALVVYGLIGIFFGIVATVLLGLGWLVLLPLVYLSTYAAYADLFADAAAVPA